MVIITEGRCYDKNTDIPMYVWWQAKMLIFASFRFVLLVYRNVSISDIIRLSKQFELKRYGYRKI